MIAFKDPVVYIIDIENELSYIELILLKYVKYVENAIYIKGSRYPIMDRNLLDKYSELNMVSDKPYNPFYSALLIKSVIELRAYDNNPHRMLLDKNVIIDQKDRPIYDLPNGKHTEYKDIVLSIAPNIIYSDYESIENMVSVIMDKINPILLKSIESVYDVDIETDKIIIKDIHNITEYRYYEAINHLDNNGDSDE